MLTGFSCECVVSRQVDRILTKAPALRVKLIGFCPNASRFASSGRDSSTGDERRDAFWRDHRDTTCIDQFLGGESWLETSSEFPLARTRTSDAFSGLLSALAV